LNTLLPDGTEVDDHLVRPPEETPFVSTQYEMLLPLASGALSIERKSGHTLIEEGHGPFVAVVVPSALNQRTPKKDSIMIAPMRYTMAAIVRPLEKRTKEPPDAITNDKKM
jgi:hypothetical protein